MEGFIPNTDGAGNTLTIIVGQGGTSANHNANNFSLGVGISYGGGAGGGGNSPPRVAGFGGGGSWIKIGSTPWAAAGGGGGGNGRWTDVPSSPAALAGGGGGHPAGLAGQAGSGSPQPTGGTQSAGGVGGTLNSAGESGSLYTGGRALGYANIDTSYGASGGGGGGYYGGGGGGGPVPSGSNGQTGAGGSNFAHASMTSVTHYPGNSGSGTDPGLSVNTGDPDYVTNVGKAGGGGTSTFGGPGENGLVVVHYTPEAYIMIWALYLMQ